MRGREGGKEWSGSGEAPITRVTRSLGKSWKTQTGTKKQAKQEPYKYLESHGDFFLIFRFSWLQFFFFFNKIKYHHFEIGFFHWLLHHEHFLYLDLPDYNVFCLDFCDYNFCFSFFFLCFIYRISIYLFICLFHKARILRDLPSCSLAFPSGAARRTLLHVAEQPWTRSFKWLHCGRLGRWFEEESGANVHGGGTGQAPPPAEPPPGEDDPEHCLACSCDRDRPFPWGHWGCALPRGYPFFPRSPSQFDQWSSPVGLAYPALNHSPRSRLLVKGFQVSLRAFPPGLSGQGGTGRI